MALAGEGARSDAIDERRRRGSVTTLFLVFLFAAPGYTPIPRKALGLQGPYEDGALWPMCGVWDGVRVYRPISISRPITFYFIYIFRSCIS